MAGAGTAGAGTSGAAVVGFGAAFPPTARQDEVWEGFFASHYRSVLPILAKRIFENSGVVTRHSVVNPLVEDVSGWSTSRRMARYLVEAVPLGRDAVGKALAAAGVDPVDLGLFVVCSCTGYVAPGLDVLLARDLGMGAGTRRLVIGHMGCYAALPGLGAAADYVATHGRPALLLCLELTTLHLQPPLRDVEQIVVHSLFSDAAAAVVLRPQVPGYVPGYAVREVAAVTDVANAGYMTWDITDHGFRMGLSAKVPDALAQHVRGLVSDLLDRHGLAVADVDGWAVHPGGPRILDVVRDELGLPEAAMSASRETLAEHGNCSSPTVLLVLDALRRQAGGAPRTVVMLAFGPGLTLYAGLLTLPG